MANSGVSEEEPSPTAGELKKELKKLVQGIVDEDDVNLEDVDTAQMILSAIKEIKMKKTAGSLKSRQENRPRGTQMDSSSVAEVFICPISGEIMRDPVIIASGKTFDRPFIQKWLKDGNRTCPETQQVLTHTLLTPNHLVRELISQCCKEQGIQLPDNDKYFDESGLTKGERDNFFSLLGKMSSTLSEQKQAAKELRQLTKKMPSFRALFSEYPDAIHKLLSPLSQIQWNNEMHSCLQENVITILLNISIHDSNKKPVAETPSVIPLIVEALNTGTIETRSNAAAALFTLSALDSNKTLIGKSGAMKALIDLLDEGNPLAMKDAASAIFNLCMFHDNKLRAVKDGAVRVLLDKIMKWINVNELVSLLAMLASNPKAIEEMVDRGAVPCLLSIIRKTSCPRNQENCIAILYTICFSDRSKWRKLRDEEHAHRTISHLAQNGTSRAKRKASGILERLNRSINLTHTA